MRRIAEPLRGGQARLMARAALRPRADFVRAGRDVMRHPATLYGFGLPMLLLATGIVKPGFVDPWLPEAARHALTAIKLAALWLVGWGLLGPVAWVVMQRGLPFCLAPIGLGLSAVLASNLAEALLMQGLGWSPWFLLREAAVVLAATVYVVHVTAPFLRLRLGDVPDLVPIWLGTPGPQVPLVLRLPAERRGRLKRIHAANQYVEIITDQGATLMRMSLRDAVAQVPDGTGWLCHRSLWISREEVVALAYVRGQPQITDRTSQSWPISRSMAPEIRAWLSASGKDAGSDPQS